MSVAILALLSAPQLVAAEAIDPDAQAEIAALCEKDPFYLAVVTDLRAAFDTKMNTPVKQRRTLDAQLLLKADTYVGILENGERYALQSAFFARPKGSGADELPDFHKYLFLTSFAECAPIFRAAFDRALGPDRAQTTQRCTGLPVNITDWSTYILLGGKGQANYLLHGDNALTVMRPVKQKDGSTKLEPFNPAFGFRNDVAREAAAEASAARKAAEDLAKAQAAAKAAADKVASLSAAVPPQAPVGAEAPAPEAAAGM